MHPEKDARAAFDLVALVCGALAGLNGPPAGRETHSLTYLTVDRTTADFTAATVLLRRAGIAAHGQIGALRPIAVGVAREAVVVTTHAHMVLD